MATRLIYYSEELDTEIEVIIQDNIDIEELEPKRCIFTGEEIDDYWYEAVSYTHLTLPTKA